MTRIHNGQILSAWTSPLPEVNAVMLKGNRSNCHQVDLQFLVCRVFSFRFAFLGCLNKGPVKTSRGQKEKTVVVIVRKEAGMLM